MKTIYKTTCARLMTLLVLALLSASNVWGKEGDVLAEVQGTGSGYGRQTTTDSYKVGWVTIGQSGYFGINSAKNNTGAKAGVNAIDLPVAKAVDASATSSTSTSSNSCTGYYTFYTTTALKNAGSIVFYYSANSGNSDATAYVVMGDEKSESGGTAYVQVPLATTSTSKQGASLETSGTFTFTFAETQTSAKYYGVVIKTSSYKRMTEGKITIKEGATGPTKTLTSIAISGNPTKTTYETGETFDPAGLTVTGTYSDASTDDLTDEAEWTFEPATFTSTSQTSVSVTATVSGKSDTKEYIVTVNEHVVTPGTYEISLNNALYGISAGENGTEQSVTRNDITVVSGKNSGSNTYYDTSHIRYYVGSYLKLSVPEGYEITRVTFAEPTSDSKWDATADEGITVGSGTYTNSSKTWVGSASQLQFDFSKQCRAASIEVTYAVAKQKTLKSISVSGQQTTFWKGDAFVFGGTVTATYEEDDVDDENVTASAEITGYNGDSAGKQTITVSYKGKSTTYDVTVNTIANTEETAYTTADAIAIINAGKDLASAVYVKGRISEIVKCENGYITYWLDDNAFQVYHGKNLENVSFTSADDIEVGADVVVYGKIKKYSSTYEFDEGNYLASYSAPAKTVATIELGTYATTLKAGEYDEYTVTYNGDGKLSITSSDEDVAEAIIVDGEVLIDAKAGGTTTITISAPETENYFSASKTYTLTVVGPATLPFAYNSGASGLTTGMTQSGLGTDYSSAPKLKFDTTGDNLVIWFGEQAGYVSYDIKGNGYEGKDAAFDVMESADGVTYTTVASYTTLSGTTTTMANTLNSDSRYVKFVYTKKSSGNVALGNICINKPVIITDAGWATAYVPFAATVTGATAYYVTVEGSSAKLHEIEGTIPANTGVVLKGAAGTATFTESAVAPTTDVSANVLKGTLEAKTQAELGETEIKLIYVLNEVDGKVGFYHLDGTLAANRAYMEVAVGVGVKAFFFDEEATGIQNSQFTIHNGDVMYNLNGQVVGKDYKGIVIVNGKKMLNK